MESPPYKHQLIKSFFADFRQIGRMLFDLTERQVRDLLEEVKSLGCEAWFYLTGAFA